MSHQLIWENEGVVSRFEGVFSPEIHVKAINALFSDPRIDFIKYIIGDYSGITENLLDETDVEYSLAMTMGAATYLTDLNIALVAKDKEIIELCNNYIDFFSQVNTTWKVRLFADIDSARDWLLTLGKNTVS